MTRLAFPGAPPTAEPVFVIAHGQQIDACLLSGIRVLSPGLALRLAEACHTAIERLVGMIWFTDIEAT